MKLRTRVTIAATVAVLVSVVLVSVAVYLFMEAQLRTQIDVILKEQGDRAALAADGNYFVDTGPVDQSEMNSLFQDWYLQGVGQDGRAQVSFGAGPLPVTPEARAVAGGRAPAMLQNVATPEGQVRVYTVPTKTGAIRFGRSLDNVERSLDRLRIALIAIGALGVLVAAILARFLATKAIEPVHRLSDAARSMKRTQDLSQRLPVQGTDEVASMAASFNEVLADLEHSQDLQRQLVADASHELRTPLTTLRTNIEVLARGYDLPPAERDRILADLTGQLADLTELVGALVDLARDEAASLPAVPVKLEDIADRVVERARRQRPNLTFEVSGSSSPVMAPPDRLDRAISNLVDNAAKWSPPAGRVTVTIAEESIAIRDEGPGIDPQDVPHVFDRFYRSPAARQMPGSGLGLSIVMQIAQSLGGTVEIHQPDGAGTEFVLRLPPATWADGAGRPQALSTPTPAARV